jgi:hypothetical protein
MNERLRIGSNSCRKFGEHRHGCLDHENLGHLHTPLEAATQIHRLAVQLSKETRAPSSNPAASSRFKVLTGLRRTRRMCRYSQ